MIRHLAALTLVAALAVLPACGDDEPEPASRTSTAASSEAFPVTIEHKYGATEIAEAPKRIVTVGLNEQDAFFALGVAPVAVTDWIGLPNGIGPWAREAAAKAGAKPQLLNNLDGIDFEKVAAARPDVIVAHYSDLEKGDYDKLSQIAPTVAPPKGVPDWRISWQESTRVAGKIVGKSAVAEKLVSGLEARFDDEAAAHPEFRGKVATMAMPNQGIWVYGPDDPRSTILTELGFKLPPGITKLFVGDYAGKISDEQIGLLDVDAVVWFATPEEARKLERNPLYTRLAVHREHRDFVMLESRPDKAYHAIGFSTVLSLPSTLDVLVPALAAITDGDPETVPREG
jgi:iron complex transport system substrate-binding protein